VTPCDPQRDRGQFQSFLVFFTFSPFAFFKEKEKEFISSFLFEAFEKKKKILFLSLVK
jgi:hypothetical protein